MKLLASSAVALGAAVAATPAAAGPDVCIGAMTDVQVLFHVRHAAYFADKPPDKRHMRIEYVGCGYRIHVGESAPNAHDGDLLFVDRYGRVTMIVRRR